MIQNPSTLFESHILANTDKPYYNLQFPARQTIRIHSSQKRRTPSSQIRMAVTPYKGPPPRTSTNDSFFQPLILTQQRNLRKSQPNMLEGIVKQVSILPKKKMDTTTANSWAFSNQNKKSSDIKMHITDTDKHHKVRVPIRATKTDKVPVKLGFETDRSWRSLIRDTSKLRSRKRAGDSLDAGLIEDRYSNIKFVKNDRSKSQCDIQYHITSADIIIPATDNRYPVIEEAMREYSLDFIPENSKYIISQNPLTQNYSVVFTEKSIPTCKECLLPICLELSYKCGFRILCKSGYCSKQILYASRLNAYAIQELWSSSPLDFPSIPQTERQDISRMIQNGIYKHRDIARTLTDWKVNSNKRPQTSLSPSRNQSQRRENQYSLPTSVYQTKLGATRKSVDWRRYTESIMRDTKNSFSRTRSPNRVDSFSMSRNNSVCRNDESKDEVENLNLKTCENK